MRGDLATGTIEDGKSQESKLLGKTKQEVK